MRSSPASSPSVLSVALLGMLLCQSGCATAATAPAAAPGEPAPAPAAAPAQPAPAQRKAPETPPPFASTYKALPSPAPVLITNATVLDGTGRRIEGGSVLMRDGKIAAVGQSLEAPAGAIVVDGTGKWVTPGIIDAHSHLGVYSSPEIDARDDGNEDTDPNTAEVWAEHSIWPQDPQFPLALAGGVTSQQILP
ncbi:MAG TPA: amidohydrolase, partial [Thermoanaerobaculia bacterium]|nr:amidohydrolase [Thermoanaerobaculia bacterium]